MPGTCANTITPQKNDVFWRRPIIIVLSILSALVFFYSEILLSLVDLWWNNETYSHGFLVLAVSTYLVWEKRSVFVHSYKNYHMAEVFCVAFISIACWAAYLAGVKTASIFFLVLLIVAIYWALYGFKFIQSHRFPLLYLMLALPIWRPVELLLQWITIKVTSGFLSVINIPVLVKGYYIEVAGGQFHVEASCAGLRFFLAALGLSMLYSYLNKHSQKSTLFCIASAVLLAMVVNWVRVIIVVYYGNLSLMQHYIVKNHAMLGWWLFVCAVVVMIALWKGAEKTGFLQKRVPEPVTEKVKSFTTQNTKVNWKQALVIFTMVVLPPIYGIYLQHTVIAADINLDVMRQGDWNGPTLIRSPEKWQPDFIGVDSSINGGFTKDWREVLVYVGFYGVQSQGSEMINELNAVYQKNQWISVADKSKKLDLPGNSKFAIRESLIKSNTNTNRAVWYWFYVAGKTTSSEIWAKILYVLDIVHYRKGSSVIAISTEYEGSPENGRKILQDFISEYQMNSPQTYQEIIQIRNPQSSHD